VPRLAPQDPDILTAGQLALRLDIKDLPTIRKATGADGIPGIRVGQELRYSWRAVYEWLAGPGVPQGEILDAAELGRRIGASERRVRRAAAAPGTPGKLPGRQVGKKWRFAWEACRAAIASPGLPDAAGGDGQPAG
jgi:hypothetical protein